MLTFTNLALRFAAFIRGYGLASGGSSSRVREWSVRIACGMRWRVRGAWANADKDGEEDLRLVT